LINKSFVKLIPKVPYEKVKEIQLTFDLYMIPRLDLPVTNIVSPIKPFEPMSLKIPLIMSDCLCLNKISNNGKNCVIFKRNNFDDFKEKVLYILTNGYNEELLKNSYDFVKNERSWENIIEHIGLYELV
jgi:glycosyltransferase involved in cell wall biosynthesis